MFVFADLNGKKCAATDMKPIIVNTAKQNECACMGGLQSAINQHDD